MSHNTFIYRVMEGDDNLAKEIAIKIEEELNKGFAFTISKESETIIPLEGVWKGWVSTEIINRDIYVYVVLLQF